MLSPGKSAAVTNFSDEWMKLSVSPAWLSSEVLKSDAVILVGFLQRSPLMKIGFSECVAAGQMS